MKRELHIWLIGYSLAHLAATFDTHPHGALLVLATVFVLVLAIFLLQAGGTWPLFRSPRPPRPRHRRQRRRGRRD